MLNSSLVSEWSLGWQWPSTSLFTLPTYVQRGLVLGWEHFHFCDFVWHLLAVTHTEFWKPCAIRTSVCALESYHWQWWNLGWRLVIKRKWRDWADETRWLANQNQGIGMVAGMSCLGQQKTWNREGPEDGQLLRAGWVRLMDLLCLSTGLPFVPSGSK